MVNRVTGKPFGTLGEQSNKLMCECGCQTWEHTSRMTSFAAEQHERQGKELRTRSARHFNVLPAHLKSFMAELNAMNAMRQLVITVADKNIFVRLWCAPTIYKAQAFIGRRIKGRWQSHLDAERVTIVFVAPEWLRIRLSLLWNTRQRVAPPVVLPRGVRGPLS